jgi:hypothetical protein
VSETATGGSHGWLAWRSLGWCLPRRGLHGCGPLRTDRRLVTRLATGEAREGHTACGGGRRCLPRTLARALSRVALSGAVPVGGVGTTTTARSSSLGKARAGLRWSIPTLPLGRGARGTLAPAPLLLALPLGVILQTIPLHLQHLVDHLLEGMAFMAQESDLEV